MFVERYTIWYDKAVKNLQCTKGVEASELLNRFQRLKLREGLLGARVHAETLHRIISGFLKERKNLRWVKKLEDDCERWGRLFEATIRASQVDCDEVIEALANNEIDIDLAVGLI